MESLFLKSYGTGHWIIYALKQKKREKDNDNRHSYHRQLMYTALWNFLFFYQWKYPCQKKRKRKSKKWCGRFPHLILIQHLRRRWTSASMPRENLLPTSDELFFTQICTSSFLLAPWHAFILLFPWTTAYQISITHKLAVSIKEKQKQENFPS